MQNDLDTLLCAPLASVDDAGFSARIASQIAQRYAVTRRRREILEWIGLPLASVIFIALVPLASVMHTIETLTLNVGNSLPVAIALAALILTAAFTQSVVDRPD
jgi:hypothetical protein